MKRTLTILMLAAFAAFGSLAQEALRPEVGKPLQAAGDLAKAGKYREALGKVAEADKVGNKTAGEVTTIDRMRLSVALGAGDVEQAVAAFERLSAAGKLEAADKLRIMESLAGSYYRANSPAKATAWAQRYLKEGGTSAAMRSLVAQAQVDSGDFSGIAKQLSAEVAADEKAGKAPPEDRLLQLGYAQQKLNDDAGYALTIERLATHYPKKTYWADLTARVQRLPGFSDRLGLELLRFKAAAGILAGTDETMELAQLALQAGSSAEAKKVVEQGYASGALGTGDQAPRHKRLADLVDKTAAQEASSGAAALAEATAAKDGNALVTIGFNRVMAGDAAKGLALIEQGIAKGGLKRPDDAQLRLGVAQLRAGQKAQGLKTLRAVRGADGSAAVAHLWVLRGA